MPNLDDRECDVCGTEFTPRNSLHRYCSVECKAKAKVRHRRRARREIKKDRIGSIATLREQMKEWAKIEGTKGAREKMAAIE